MDLNAVRPVVAAIHENERALWICEADRVLPPNYQNRRYQVITVVRDDAPADCWFDLGPAENFTAPGFVMPVAGVIEVAELRDIATTLRQRDNYWQKFMEEETAASTLISDAISWAHERKHLINNESTFGPGFTKQRNGAPSELKEIHRAK